MAGAPPVRKNIFSGMKGAAVTPDANYLGPGNYWLRIDKIKQSETRKNIAFVAAEMTVIRVIAAFQDCKPHMVGEEVSHLFMSDSDYFMADVKKFLGGLFGVPPNDVAEDDIITASGQKLDANGMLVDDLDAQGKQKQPLRFMVAEYNNRMQVSEQNKEFTRHKLIREVPPDEVLKSLAPLDVERFFPGNFLQNKIAQSAKK